MPKAYLSLAILELKKSSNGWVGEQTGFSGFNWQEGYIDSQVGHHRTKSFQIELMELSCLRQYSV